MNRIKQSKNKERMNKGKEARTALYGTNGDAKVTGEKQGK